MTNPQQTLSSAIILIWLKGSQLVGFGATCEVQNHVTLIQPHLCNSALNWKNKWKMFSTPIPYLSSFFKLHFYSPEIGNLLLKLLNCASNIYYSWNIKKIILLEFLFIFCWLLDWEKPRWCTWRLQMLSFLEK